MWSFLLICEQSQGTWKSWRPVAPPTLTSRWRGCFICINANMKRKEEEGTGSSFQKQVMAATIQSLLEEISGVEDPIEELQSLKTALLAIPVSALRESVSGQRLDVVFSLLDSNDRLVWLSFNLLHSETAAWKLLIQTTTCFIFVSRS